METNRRLFLQTAGLGWLATQPRAEDLVAAADAVPEPRPHQITELFLDNDWIEASPGVTRRLHPPRKHVRNPVIRPERWCEGTYLEPYTTLYDPAEKLFKMWARAGSDTKAGFVGGNAGWMVYYTSRDGVHWDRPDLGLFEVDGRRDHNIVFASDLVPRQVTRRLYGPADYVRPSQPVAPQGKKAFFWAVNRHPRPRDPSETYVALAIVQDHRRGAHIVTSPDGLNWSCAPTPFWQTPHDVAGNGDDCLMDLVFDDERNRWVIYRRIIPEFSERMIATAADTTRPPIDRYNRAYARAESEDLQHWTDHRFIAAMDPDDPADTELYQLGCHRVGSTWIGLFSIFYLRRPQPINVHLATSRDGIHFTRVCRGEPFIPHGPLGYYDFMAMACSQPRPIIVNDIAHLYYAALNYPHDVDESASRDFGGGVALVTFPRDRYASLETAPEGEPCRLLTKPFTITHPRLFLNASTWNQGSLRVEVLTRDWQPIPGYTLAETREIRGDALDHPVTWTQRNDLAELVGKEIRLKFHMARARLHAMTFSDAPRPLGEVAPQYRTQPATDSAPRQN
jgi:hypothetical protein